MVVFLVYAYIDPRFVSPHSAKQKQPLQHQAGVFQLIEGVGAMGYGTSDLPLQIEDTSLYVNGALWSTDPYGN